MAIRPVCTLMTCENSVPTPFAHAIHHVLFKVSRQVYAITQTYPYNDLHLSSRWCAIMAGEAGPKKCVGGSSK